MGKITDPVCGMTIDSATAAATSTHKGETYYFCSVACKRDFDADPSRYARATSRERDEGDDRAGASAQSMK